MKNHKFHVLLIISCLMILAAFAFYRFGHSRAADGYNLLERYFTVEGYTIVDMQRVSGADAAWQGSGGLWINLNARAIVPKGTLTEERCNPSLPPYSMFYKEIDGTDFSNEKAVGNYLGARSQLERKILARLEVHCYQVTKDRGRGFPRIKVFHDRATGNATIAFPYHML